MINTMITGGNRGLGKIISLNLLKKGHIITNLSKSNNIPIELQKNINFNSYKCDITNYKNTNKIITNIINKKNINNIILNGGITDDSFFHKMTYEQWNNVIDTNLKSIYNVLYPVINQMRENNKGNIIFISSVNAHKPVLGQTNYSASKNAIIAFNRCLAYENSSKNIKCNVISPGYINTEMTEIIPEKIKNNIINEIPEKRFCDPEEINKIINLLIDDNTYIQGSNIDINGGLFMR